MTEMAASAPPRLKPLKGKRKRVGDNDTVTLFEHNKNLDMKKKTHKNS